MKHIFLLPIMLVGLTVMSSCQKDEIENSIPKDALILTAEGFHTNTKTSVESNSVQWVGNESVRINGHDYSVNVADGKAYITQGGNPINGDIRAYYACGNITNEDSDAPTVTIKSNYSCSYDGSGHNQVLPLPMVATASDGANSIQFKHLTAAVKVIVRNEFSDKTLVVDRVSVSSEHYVLCGQMTLNLSDVTNFGVNKQSGEGSVTIDIPSGLAVPFYNNNEDNLREIQVPIRPIDNDHPITITIIAHESGNASYTYTFNHTENIPNNLNRNMMLSAGCRLHTGTGNHVSVGDPSTPLTFEAKTAGATVTFNSQGLSINMEYSLNDGSWTTYTDAITLDNIGDKVAFRGNNTTFGRSMAIFSIEPVNFSCTGQCYLYGNIMSLLFSTTYASETTLPSDNVFEGLFFGNTAIYNHPYKSLILPATTLTKNCYDAMFMGCTNLTFAPVLPALILEQCCYRNMFRECTNLTIAPTLPAKYLASSCYGSMFKDCTGLTSAPALPATTVYSSSYSGMFSGCTSLTSAPELQAKTLSESCYSGMFYGCSNLTYAPELPVYTAMPVSCYESMFANCTSLTTAPALPSISLSTACYREMFSGCTSLTSAPALRATTSIAQSCYEKMFKGCTSLTTAPDLRASYLSPKCYLEMFKGCTSLNSIKCLATNISASNCTDDWLDGVSATGTFTKASSMSSWTSGASGIPSGWTVINQ